jgi:LytTr DNA-binding domain
MFTGAILTLKPGTGLPGLGPAWKSIFWLPALVPVLIMAGFEIVQFQLFPVFQAPNVSPGAQAFVTLIVFYGPVVLIPRLSWAVNSWLKANGAPFWRLCFDHAGAALALSSLHMILVTLGLAIMHSPPGWLPHFPRFVGEVWLAEFPRWILVYGLVATVLWYLQTGRGSSRDLEIRENGQIHFVPMTDIIWAEATGNYICLHTADRRYTHRESLAQFAARDAGVAFLRVHRSALVRATEIRAIRSQGSGRYSLVLKSGEEIKLSRRRLPSVRKALTA